MQTRRKALDVAMAIGQAETVGQLVEEAATIERYMETGETDGGATDGNELGVPALDLTAETLAHVLGIRLGDAIDMARVNIDAGRWQRVRPSRPVNGAAYRLPQSDVPAKRLHLVPDSARGGML